MRVGKCPAERMEKRASSAAGAFGLAVNLPCALCVRGEFSQQRAAIANGRSVRSSVKREKKNVIEFRVPNSTNDYL